MFRGSGTVWALIGPLVPAEMKTGCLQPPNGSVLPFNLRPLILKPSPSILPFVVAGWGGRKWMGGAGSGVSWYQILELDLMMRL